MNRRTFTRQLLTTVPALAAVQGALAAGEGHTITLYRHATIAVKIGRVRLAIDPMFSAKDAMDPVGNAGNNTRNPMVEVPYEPEIFMRDIDAVLLTHTHRDHWDAVAQEKIDKGIPIFCQPTDVDKIKEKGFTNVTPVADEVKFKGARIYRTPGQHGSGEVGKKMGTVSGFVIRAAATIVYIAGDTIWCDDVKSTLKKYKPETVVVNAGGARFLEGGPITMTAEDVIQVARAVPAAQVVAVHMNTINHCVVRRMDLRQALESEGIGNVKIPPDGSSIRFGGYTND